MPSQGIAGQVVEVPERDREPEPQGQQCLAALGDRQGAPRVVPADGTCWAAAGMVRRGHDFTDRETEFLAAVAPAIASATRLAVRSEASLTPGGQPAIVVVGPRGELRAITAPHRNGSAFDQISPRVGLW